jgi:hypothetical protein
MTVIRTATSRLLEDSRKAEVVLLGEDHRSPLPDAIGAEMLRKDAFDCVALELHQDLQVAVDQYASGRSWTRTVWPAVRQVFGTAPLALGQDQQMARTARARGIELVAVDRFPRRLMREIRHQRRTGQPVSGELTQATVHDRDEAMGEALADLVASGRCERVLFTVGWNHVPGLTEHLGSAGVPVHATIIDHTGVPPLPDTLSLTWEDGRIAVE